MQNRPPTRSNAARSEATRAALLAAARRLFVESGYANTSTPAVVEAAQVTRGALYHHFADKTELFMAVAMQAAQEVAHEVAAGASGQPTPVEELAAGAEAYFAAMAREGRARLLLQDAPAILSHQQLRRLSEAAGAAELLDGVRAVVGGGASGDPPVSELAEVLSASFDRAALAIASGGSASRYKRAVNLLLAGLAPAPRARRRVPKR